MQNQLPEENRDLSLRYRRSDAFFKSGSLQVLGEVMIRATRAVCVRSGTQIVMSSPLRRYGDMRPSPWRSLSTGGTLRRVAQAFDYAGTMNTMGAPSFA